MSNGQAEIERLEAATSAFEEIITTENDTVDVPNVGTTPSLKKRVEDGLDQRVPGPQVYMQSKPSQLDEYGYPLRTLYENGDGFITYYPAYAVFRKDGGAWEYVTPHLRNVANFNGTTQYAKAPRVNEIDLDDQNLEFEIECEILPLSSNTAVVLQDSQFITTANQYRLMVFHNSTTVSFRVGGFNCSIPAPSGFLGTKHKLICGLSMATDTAYIKLDDAVTIFTGITGVEEYEWDESSVLYIGVSSYNQVISYYYLGQLSNIKIWTGGDRNTGTLTRHYRIDEGWRGDNNKVLVNYATELGEDIMPNAQVVPSNGTAELNGDIYTISRPDEPAGGYVQVRNLVAGNPYLVETSTKENNDDLSIRNVSGGEIAFYLPGPLTDYLGVYNATRSLAFYNTGTIGEFSATFKQAPGYGTYVGLTEASWTEETV